VGKVILKRLNDKIKIYKDKHKKQLLLPNPKSEDPDTLTWDLSDATQRKNFLSIKDNLWIEGYAVSKNSGDTGLQLTYRPIKPLSGGVLQDIIDTMKCTVWKEEYITPAGDPVNEPDNEGDGQNEFTYSEDNPGVLKINLKVKIYPEKIASHLKERVYFEVDCVGDSQKKWKDENKDGKPTVDGDYLKAEVKFIKLPKSNSDFGRKYTRFYFDRKEMAKQEYEVFFPKKAMNNPNGKVPNWFYYWKEGKVCGIPDNAIYDPSKPNCYGYVKPWKDSIVRLCPKAAGKNDGPEKFHKDDGTIINTTGEGKGIKCVAEVIEHELHHIKIYKDNYGKKDTDGDGIADENEWGYDGVYTDINDPDTYNLGGSYATDGDQEVRCRKAELNLTIKYYPELDWANPGCQSYNQWGPLPGNRRKK